MESSASPRSSRIGPRGRTALQCNFCGREFFKTDHLNRHERSHTKERPFRCTECDKSFGRNDTLLRHLKKLHNIPETEGSTPTVSTDHQPASRGVIDQQNAMDHSRSVVDPNLLPGVDQFAGDNIFREVGTMEWSPPVEFPDRCWWFDYKFDPNTLDMSLFEPMAFSQHFTPHLSSEDNLPPHNRILPGPDIQKSWFTYIDQLENSNNFPPSKDPVTDDNEGYKLDEDFRQQASQRLKFPQHVDPLPSTGLLNLSVKIFIENFIPLFPIIHGHTLRPSPENSPLLLVMSALGCLLLGEDGTRCLGARTFEQFNSTAMASWDAIRPDSQEALSLVQAAILAQIFGLLSGSAKHLSMVDNFQGTVIAWARRCDTFRRVDRYPEINNLDPTALEQEWKSWAKSEEVIRAVLGLYIIDAQLAAIFHHDPLLRHDSMNSNRAADDDIFNATSAVEWKAKLLFGTRSNELHASSYNNSQFNFYVVLQNISARISEEQNRGRLEQGSDVYKRIYDDLISWRGRFEEHTTPQRDMFDLMTLWHASFLMLLIDFNKIERALGRDGLHNMFLESDISYAVSWSKSPAADRSALHAYEIEQKISGMRLSTEPAIHTPHCAFLAGVVAYTCLRFRRPAMLAQYPPPHQRESRTPADFPEFNIHGELERDQHFQLGPLIFENQRGETFMRTLSPRHPIVIMGAELHRHVCEALLKMGHFEIARSYAKTTKALILVEIEKWMHGMQG